MDEAEKMYQRALQGYEKAWGRDHPSTLRTLNNLKLLNASRSEAHDLKQHFQSLSSTATAVLYRLKAGMRRRKRGT